MSDMNLDDLIRAGGNASRMIDAIDGAINATIHNNIVDDDCNNKKYHLSEKKAVKNITLLNQSILMK